MKKYSYLIIIVLISSLVLTGCSLLSNIGQAPATEQSGITYLTKGGPAPDPSLVGLWHFDGDARDSSGYDNDGILYNFVSPWVSGRFGQALKFDGVDDYIEVLDSASLDITGAITVECWVKSEQAAYQTLISKWSAVDNQRSYLVALTADNKVRFWITEGGTWGTLKELTSSGTIGTEWTHIAATYDGTKMNIYINSSKDANEFAPTISIFTGTAQLMFGVHPAYITDGWAPRYFKGILDQVRIWDRALTDSEIAYNYKYSLREVEIDIKPDSDPNSINLGSNGVVPVAILGSPDFDAATVNPSTVTLAGATVKFKGKSGNAGSLEDVNGDGELDLVVQVYTSELPELGDGVIFLTAYTYDGLAISGIDEVRIVQPK